MSSIFTIPAPLKAFYSHFPLKTWEPIYSGDANAIDRPTVWILPPRTPSSDAQPLLLSSDVECLKWQAFIALRGLSDIAVRWDVSPDGGIDGRLPNLHVPREASPDDGGGELLAAHMIPGWVDKTLGEVGSLEGYKDEATKDESHAWVSLLEGKVHAALALSQPEHSFITSIFMQETSTPYGSPLAAILSPPPPPLSGFSSLLPPYGVHVSSAAVELQYKDAISSLSERLGTDKWLLSSENPTALDALLFAYLHTILHTKSANALRLEITRRVNLVAWERRVRSQVAAAFVSA
ncbi:hypothetical protein HWV62_8419 [Athelia sp. TMB]|nr:hypothetical protein HWV62_8419 [Athelia sp. TMB]